MTARRRHRLPLLLALALGASAARSADRALLELPAGTMVLEADPLVLELGARRYIGIDATLRGNRLVLHADRLVLDARSDEAIAENEVVLVRGDTVITARRLTYNLDTERLRLDDGAIYFKSGVDPQALAAADTPRRAKLTGANSFTVTAARLEQTGPLRYEADDVSFTPCDCVGDVPTWRVEGSSAIVNAGQSVWLFWPVLYVWKIPLPILVPLYMPMSDRRTGLLFPSITLSGPNGFGMEEQLFVAPSRSADVTLGLGFLAGRGAEGIRGPHGTFELRYTPSERAAGNFWVQDFRDWREPAGLQHRPQLRFAHNQRAGGAEIYADASLVRDTRLLAQLVLDPLARPDYLGSRARVEAPGALWAAGAWGTYLQDLRAGAAGLTRPLFGSGAAPQIHRAPQLFAARVGHKLAGPVTVSGQADLGYFPIAGAAEIDSVGRPSGMRAAFEPALRAPFHFGDALLLVAEGVGRADAYAYPGAPELNRIRAGGYVGARLSTALERDYGSARHRIEPQILWRLSPGFTRKLPALPFSEDGRPFEGGRMHQASLVIETRLDEIQGGGVRPLLGAAVGQGVDLARHRVAEAWARVGFGAGPVSLRGEARYDWASAKLAAVFGQIGLADTRGDSLGVQYSFTRSGVGDRLRAGLWELFGTGATSAEAGVQSVQLNLGLALTYGLAVSGQATWAFGRGLSAQPVYTVGISYTSPCACLRTSLTAVSAPDAAGQRGFPQISPSLDWESLGGGSSFRFPR